MRPCAEFAIGRLLDTRIEPQAPVSANYFCGDWRRSREQAAGCAGAGCSGADSRRRGLCRRDCPTWIAARLAQFVFEIGDVCFVLRDHRGLCRQSSLLIVQVLAGILLLQRADRVRVKLLLLQIVFALQDVEFVRIVR